VRPTLLVVIGASWGGVDAVRAVLKGLSPDVPAAFALVQHRGMDMDDQLTRVLQTASALRVQEVVDKDLIERGRFYVAPSGYHLLVEGDTFALSTDAPVSHARPSIDVLFETAADAYRGLCVGVALTGASKDGANGLACIKRAGGFTVVQEPNSAESRILPDAALAASKVDRVLAVHQIGSFLTGHCYAAKANRPR
jgi:two-component system, chemotaxis family, protein-glutamate methylesterase/glutaminase